MNLAIFDIDGTLTQPYPGEDPAFVEGLQQAFGFDDVDVNWDTYPHVTDTGIVQHLFEARRGRAATTVEMSEFQRRYSHAFIARATPDHGRQIAGAGGFIDGLNRDPDWCIAIATGNCLRMARLKLERARIPYASVPMATADDAISRAELVRLAIAKAQAAYGVRSFQHMVSIGDAPWDLRTARELEIPFVAVGFRCGHPSTGARAIPDYSDADGVRRALMDSVCW